MAVITYATFAGRIVREDRAGVQRYYGQHTLGSTAALYDTSGNKTDEYDYWPYGEIRSHTGSSTTPFTFVGTLGYTMDQAAQLYVSARFLMTNLARWLTTDPLWPMLKAYGYVDGQPTAHTDPDGTRPVRPGLPSPVGGADCQGAGNCIAHGGCSCADQGPDCYKVGSSEVSCCVDLDGDGIGHVIAVKIDYCVCYFTPPECSSAASGKTTPFPVPTGEWRLLRNKRGRLIKCFV